MNGIGKGFVVGLAAGGVALVISYMLRILGGGLFVPELASQTLFSLTPGTIESQAVAILGPFAKYSAFVGAIAGNIFLYGIIGMLLYAIYRRLAHKGHIINLLQPILVSYSIIFAIAMIFSEITEIATQPLTIQLVAIYLIPPHVAFGLISYCMFRMSIIKSETMVARKEGDPLLPPVSIPSSEQHDLNTVSRREFIRIVGVVAAGSIASAFVFQWIVQLLSSAKNNGIAQPPITKPSPANSTSGSANDLSPEVSSLYASEITPNDRFYKIDTSIVTPVIDSNMWRLMVKGLVENPLTLTYNELKSMPAIEQYATLECVSNEVGGDLISTAFWKGVLLKDILEKARIKPEATYIVFRCHDGYDVGIPLERGLGGTFLAYEMNGITLPADHGFPLRAIVPGIYGMMNAKWITAIELVDRVYEGFWQRKGWSNKAEHKIHSSIVVPGNTLSRRFLGLGASSTTVKLGNKVPIAGVAFAGDRGISKVEISMDDGNSWEAVKIKKPLSIKNTWVLWATEWNPRSEGRYNISVRATDGNGNIQVVGFQKPFPDGSSGYHMAGITVVKAV
ncbi:MAG: molybdopterin-dependent oxidoreductase [Nitrososphaerales archaeon]